jgi:tetratricopeptide (TPR) repeat protein
MGEHDDPVQYAFVCGNVGLAYLLTEDLERAEAGFAEQLRLCREQGVVWVAAEALSGLAAIACRKGELERAASMLGAATATGPWDVDAGLKTQLEHRFYAAAKQNLGERRWTEAQEAGARLTFEQTVDYALAPDEIAI